MPWKRADLQWVQVVNTDFVFDRSTGLTIVDHFIKILSICIFVLANSFDDRPNADSS